MRAWLLGSTFVLCMTACPAAVTSPPPVATAAAPAVLLGNATCPVSGEPVAGTPENPTFKSTFQGVTMGFMCPMHMADFENGTDVQKVAWLEKARASLSKHAAP
jgi:hypothetical protein